MRIDEKILIYEFIEELESINRRASRVYKQINGLMDAIDDIDKIGFSRSWQYQRILEILDDYWLTEPDEAFVEVQMDFRHKNGETQHKTIIWVNPNLKEEPNDTEH